MLTVAVADVFVMPPTSIEDMLGAIEVVNVAVTLLSVVASQPRLDFVSRAGVRLDSGKLTMLPVSASV